MATKIHNASADWRVRLTDGEYSLSLVELGAWITSGRVTRDDHVRPPTTRRWKLAKNAVELESFFEERRSSLAEQRAIAEAPVRAAAEARAFARATSIKRTVTIVGALLGIIGVLLFVTLTDMGIAFGIALGAIGLIIFIFGSAMKV